MSNEDEVLINQSAELISICERSVKSIDATTSTHLILMGSLSIAFSLSIDSFVQRRLVIVFLLFFLGIIYYGLWVYQTILTSHSELIINTKRLNAARRVLVKDKKVFEGKIYLPIDENEPDFDDMGFYGKKLSRNSFPRVIQWINTLLFFIFTSYFGVLVNTWKTIPYARNIFVGTYSFSSFLLNVYFGAWMYVLHIFLKKRIIQRARQKWERELKIPRNINN